MRKDELKKLEIIKFVINDATVEQLNDLYFYIALLLTTGDSLSSDNDDSKPIIENNAEDYLTTHRFLPISEGNWEVIEATHKEPKTAQERNAVNKHIRDSVGDINGIYVYANANNEILYIGKGKPIYKRLQNRYKRCYNFANTSSPKQCAFWSSNMGVMKIYYKELEDEDYRQYIESLLQKALKPKYEKIKDKIVVPENIVNAVNNAKQVR